MTEENCRLNVVITRLESPLMRTTLGHGDFHHLRLPPDRAESRSLSTRRVYTPWRISHFSPIAVQDTYSIIIIPLVLQDDKHIDEPPSYARSLTKRTGLAFRAAARGRQ